MFCSFGSHAGFGVIWVSFVVDMEKNLQATQRFLRGLVSLPTFADVKSRQLQHLRGVIEKSPCQSTAAVADLVATLDSSIWNEEELDSLKQALAQKVSEGKERRKMQDYTAFPRYLPERLWNGLLTTGNQLDRLESLVKFCISLGLRCPSEPTIAGLVWLSTSALRTQDIGETEKLSALRESKPNIRRWLTNLADPAVYLQCLPTNIADCPAALMQQAFPHGYDAYTPPGFQLGYYEDVVRRFPLRRREGEGARVTPVGLSDEYTQVLGKLFAGAVEGALSRSSSRSSAGGSSRDGHATLALLDMAAPTEEQPSMSVGHQKASLLALENVEPVPGPSDPAPAAPQHDAGGSASTPSFEGSGSPQDRVSAELEALRSSLRAPDQGEVAPDVDVVVKKRPAGKAPQGKAKKAKTGAVGVSLQSAAMKRPAACSVISMKRPAARVADTKQRLSACGGRTLHEEAGCGTDIIVGGQRRAATSLAGDYPESSEKYLCKWLFGLPSSSILLLVLLAEAWVFFVTLLACRQWIDA